MEGIQTASIIILLAAVLPGLVLGYLTAIKQKRNLIAGWDEKKVSNPEAFSRAVGYSLIAMGMFLGILLLIAQSVAFSASTFALLAMLPTVIPAFGVVYAKSKYSK